jgi:hypothetical protein
MCYNRESALHSGYTWRMNTSDVQVVARIGRYAKQRLIREAEARGVEASALLRAILQQFFLDMGDETLGWTAESVAVIQIHRADHVEIEVPRRRLSPRSRARP